MKHRSRISNLRCATSTANRFTKELLVVLLPLAVLAPGRFQNTSESVGAQLYADKISLKSAAGHPPAAPCQKESLTFSVAACSKQGHSGIPHTWPFQFLQSCNFFLHLTALCQLGTIWDELPDQLRPCSLLVS